MIAVKKSWNIKSGGITKKQKHKVLKVISFFHFLVNLYKLLTFKKREIINNANETRLKVIENINFKLVLQST